MYKKIILVACCMITISCNKEPDEVVEPVKVLTVEQAAIAYENHLQKVKTRKNEQAQKDIAERITHFNEQLRTHDFVKQPELICYLYTKWHPVIRVSENEQGMSDENFYYVRDSEVVRQAVIEELLNAGWQIEQCHDEKEDLYYLKVKKPLSA